MDIAEPVMSTDKPIKGQDSPVTLSSSDPVAVPLELARPVTVDPDGDVYLICEQLEIRVSSRVLSLASKVFNAMFQTGFQEGLELAKNETCRIPLPEDDSESMHVICLLLHHRHTEIEYDVDAEFFREIAILADKYTCISPLHYWADAMLRELGDEPGNSAYDNASLIMAAYYLDSPPHFKNISKNMVFQEERFTIVDKYGVETWESVIDMEMMPPGLLRKFDLAALDCNDLFQTIHCCN